ncbi:hypothetical protein Tdes44962_MAKER03451 [Teratosphaeria destructans]|uniref:Uncharacterized protein n=1 Tax=Teratosphaeria destructans TaxID=418781 RepID=A0A9W7SPY6_9PEZI|nr:hypothetical protein Tdes44962_MAKER03451 [Teratosphaeria destructans]
MRCTIFALVSGVFFVTGKQSRRYTAAAAAGNVSGRDVEPDNYYVDCNMTAGNGYADYLTTFNYIDGVCNSLDGITISEQANIGKLLTTDMEISLMAFPNCTQALNSSECITSYMSLLWDCGGAYGGEAASGEIVYWGGCYIDYWLSIYPRSEIAAAKTINATRPTTNGTEALETGGPLLQERQDDSMTSVTSTSTSTKYTTITVYKATTITSTNATVTTGADVTSSLNTNTNKTAALYQANSSALITATASTHASPTLLNNNANVPAFITTNSTDGHLTTTSLSDAWLTGEATPLPIAINGTLSKRTSGRKLTTWVLIALVIFVAGCLVI